MKWKEVIDKKIMPEGIIAHGWFCFKRDHIGDYDWTHYDWKKCRKDFEESDVDKGLLERYSHISVIDC